MTDIVGNSEGIKLWNLMLNSEDELEQEYFRRINQAASEYGSVWFTDIIAQRETKRNQTFFFMSWIPAEGHWDVSLFMIPEGASATIAERLPEIDIEEVELTDDGEWEDIDPSLIEAIEESIV